MKIKLAIGTITALFAAAAAWAETYTTSETLNSDVDCTTLTLGAECNLDLNGHNLTFNGAAGDFAPTSGAKITNNGADAVVTIEATSGALNTQFQNVQFSGNLKLVVKGATSSNAGFQGVHNSHTLGTVLDGYGTAVNDTQPRFTTGDAFGTGPLTLNNDTYIHLTVSAITPSWSSINVTEGKGTFVNDQVMTFNSSNNKVIVAKDSLLEFNGNTAFCLSDLDTTEVAGTIRAANSGHLTLNAAGFPNGTLEIKSGSQVRVSGDITTDVNINRLTGEGKLMHTGANDKYTTINVGDATDFTFDGVIAHDSGGEFNLTKVGDGTFTVTSNNNYYGSTTLSAGTLKLAGNGQLSATSGFDFEGGTLAFADDVAARTIAKQFFATNAALKIDVAAGVAITNTASVAQITNAFVKTGAGIFKLNGAISQEGDPLRQSSLTHTVYGVLELVMPTDKDAPTFAASLVGNGTLRLTGGDANKGYRFNAESDVLSGFTGTIDWNYANDCSSKAIGFTGTARSWPNVRFSITGAPETDTVVCHSEWTSMTFAAFDILNPTAKLYLKNAATLTIGDSGKDSTFNGAFDNKKITITKNGAGKLTVGPGFSVVDGSSLSVNAGTLIANQDVFGDLNYTLTIASGVKLTGSGVFGAVDLSVNDVVAPDLTAETDKTTEFTLLTATSIIGTSATMTELLDDVNAGDTHGKWVVTKVANGDGTVSLKCVYHKAGLAIILR